jgi:3-oxoadipate enol-lactonase
MVAGTSDEGYAGCCAALTVWDHRDRLPAITAPTLVVAGEHDQATPVEPHARTIAAGVPGARLEVVPGAHLANIESADAVTALLVEHLDG